MRRFALTVIVLLSTCVSATHGQDQSGERADRALYNQLTSRIKQIDRDYARTLEEAMKQARAGDGEADLEIQARLLSLQESRDRTMGRLVLVATRHGWDVPDFDIADPETAKPQRASPAEAIFEPAARMVQARFAREALNIVRSVQLPVISLPPPRGSGS